MHIASMRRSSPILISLVVISLAFSVRPARATDTIVRSASPYWKVGPRDKQLSALCAVGQFNERDPGHYVVRLRGKDGNGVLGIAKGNGFNLVDRGHNAQKSEDYFFVHDGSSSCSVFVGGRAASQK